MPDLSSGVLNLDETDPLLVVWEKPFDQDNPQCWTFKRKLVATGLTVLMLLNVTFASSAPTSATQAIKKDFHVSTEVSYLPTTVYLLGYVFGPFLWGPGSECYGRRRIFIVTMSLYTVFCFFQGIASNIEIFLITRFMSGFCAVAPLTNSGGVVADVWTIHGRGLANAVTIGTAFLGPSIGPIVSGFVVSSGWLSWRWVFWIMMIFGMISTILTIIYFEETFSPVLLLEKAIKVRKETSILDYYAKHEKEDWSWKGVASRTICRPLIMVATEPILSLITLYISLVYGVLYCLFQAFPLVFMTWRHFTLIQACLLFIGVGIGTTLGSALNCFLDRNYPKLIVECEGSPPPEPRLYGAMLGGIGLAIGVFWLGWTGELTSLTWTVPGASSILLGMSIIMIFISFLSYLVDTYQQFSASAFAVNTIFRSLVAASFPLYTVNWFNKMGVNWALTVIGIISFFLGASPFLFYWYGDIIRRRSQFAPCDDLHRLDKTSASDRANCDSDDEERLGVEVKTIGDSEFQLRRVVSI